MNMNDVEPRVSVNMNYFAPGTLEAENRQVQQADLKVGGGC